MVARATDEAFWTSQFDQHHPEHLAEGLAPHGASSAGTSDARSSIRTDVVDISATLDRKVDAAVRSP